MSENTGINRIPSIKNSLEGIRDKLFDLASAYQRVGSRAVATELQSYTALMSIILKQLEVVHTEELNSKVASVEQSTVNMITAALNSVPAPEERL